MKLSEIQQVNKSNGNTGDWSLSIFDDLEIQHVLKSPLQKS